MERHNPFNEGTSDKKSSSIETGEVALPQHDLDTSSKLTSSRCIPIHTVEDQPKSTSADHIIDVEKNKEVKIPKSGKKEDMSPEKKKLYSWLNKQMKIEMTDGRVLVGIFLCTDRDANVILGSCTEFLNPEVCGFTDEPRMLGLVMVPGRHIISIHHDASDSQLLMMPEEKEPAGV